LYLQQDVVDCLLRWKEAAQDIAERAVFRQNPGSSFDIVLLECTAFAERHYSDVNRMPPDHPPEILLPSWGSSLATLQFRRPPPAARYRSVDFVSSPIK
jgi:hypothetical protein